MIVSKKVIRIGFILLSPLLLVGGYAFIIHQPHQLKIVTIKNNYLHFSLDDVFRCTTRLSTYNNNSIFSDSTLSILKEWHDKYGIVVSLYVQGDFCINSKYAQELIDNHSWLKFGYHGFGEHKYDMWRFYNQIKDSIGSDLVIDSFPRLDLFHGNKITCKILQLYGCVGFLSCDDWSYNSEKRGMNYYLTSEQSTLLDNNNRLLDLYNNLYFVKSDFRLEQIKDRWGSVQDCLYYYTNNKQSSELIVFSHEWNFYKYKEQADSIFRWAYDNHFAFDFPMNQKRVPKEVSRSR